MKAIIFDLDGTLINTKLYIADSFIKTFKHLNIDINESEITNFLHLSSVDDFLKRVISENNYSRISEIKDYYIKHYDKNCSGKTKLYHGTYQLLLKLSKDYELFIATSKFSSCAKRELEENNSAHFFTHIQGTDIGIRHKPDTQIFEILSSEYGIKPQTTLMIGDTPNDVLFAKNFGGKSIAVTYGIWSKEEFLKDKIKPDLFATDISDLEKKIYLLN